MRDLSPTSRDVWVLLCLPVPRRAHSNRIHFFGNMLLISYLALSLDFCSIPHFFFFQIGAIIDKRFRIATYLDVESLVMSALATTVSDVILRQLHADQILHHQLGVVVVLVVAVVVGLVVVVGRVVLVDEPPVFGRKELVDSGFGRL